MRLYWQWTHIPLPGMSKLELIQQLPHPKYEDISFSSKKQSSHLKPTDKSADQMVHWRKLEQIVPKKDKTAVTAITKNVIFCPLAGQQQLPSHRLYTEQIPFLLFPQKDKKMIMKSIGKVKISSLSVSPDCRPEVLLQLKDFNYRCNQATIIHHLKLRSLNHWLGKAISQDDSSACSTTLFRNTPDSMKWSSCRVADSTDHLLALILYWAPLLPRIWRSNVQLYNSWWAGSTLPAASEWGYFVEAAAPSRCDWVCDWATHWLLS